MKLRLICSNRPRPQVQSNHAKWGGGSWNRDTHHATGFLGRPLYHGAKTLCGRDARDWLIIEENAEGATALESGDLCKRCGERISAALEGLKS